MLVPNQFVEIKVGSHNFLHFQNLGYEVKKGMTLFVPPEHLMLSSKAVVQVVCDLCGKITPKQYKNYNKEHTYDLDCCKKCAKEKQKITMRNRYGVDYPLQSEFIKEKAKQTCLEKYGVENALWTEQTRKKRIGTCIERYGCENPCQSEVVKKKIKETCLDKYGCECVFSNDEIKKKIKQYNLATYGVEFYSQTEECRKKIKSTCLEKYGVEHPMQNNEVQQKTIETNLARYGVKYTSQNAEVMKKIRKSLMENGTGKASSQQIDIFNIVKQKYSTAELNYPFGNCSLDIFVRINNINIDIEYDGSYWHQDQQADIRRDKFLQSNGVKVARIRSGRKIPTGEQLFSAIDELATTDRIFKEIILSDWKKQQKINEQQEVSA